ncbi:MAG: hypothetical protein U5N85_11150 [Arcicella sp.]|nr:hypothetical protein [Arcicella sp.]
MENQLKEKITIKLLNNFILPISIYLDEDTKSKVRISSSGSYEIDGKINRIKVEVRNLIQSKKIILSTPAFSIERSRINYLKLAISLLVSNLFIFLIVQNNFVRLIVIILVLAITLLDSESFELKDSRGNIIDNNTGSKQIKSIRELLKKM